MEVSGRKENTSGGSAKKSKTLCQPCGNDGQRVEAEGFCQNCKEYLCAKCITYHRKVTLSKNHVILDKRNMPTHAQQQTPTPVCTVLCDKHTTEVVKFFCKQHETVGCGDCMVLEHKACKVDYIPDIADAFLGGSEFSVLVKEINRLQSVVKSAKEELVKSEKEVGKTYLETVNDIRTFRKDIDGYLDRMEQQLLDTCDKIAIENNEMIQKIGEDFKIIEKELNTIHTQLSSMSEPSTDMFVKARTASSTLKTLEGQLSTTDEISKLNNCQLKRSRFINDVVSKCSPLGEIEVRNIAQLQGEAMENRSLVNATPKQEGFIDVKSSSDVNDCFISGIIALNDTTLACTDWVNQKVKLIDIARGTLSSEITVEAEPWDLTHVLNKEIAITLCYGKKIQFLSFTDRLYKGRSINVDGECRGITFSKNRLIVSYQGDPKVEILTLQGKVLKCIKTDHMGAAKFKWPLYVAVSCDAEFIFVSDSDAYSVIKLTFDGQVLATYEDRGLKPRQFVVCEDNYLLVCYCSSQNNVQIVSPACKKVKNILGQKDGLRSCLALCYDEDTAKLYLSNYDNRDQIQIYKMT